MQTTKDQIPKLVIKKVISAKREDVFAAWTKPELMQRWFCPPNWSAKTTNELKVGGSYSHNMISDGKTGSACNSDSNQHLHTGEYLEISPPEKLVFTWNSPSVKNTRVTIELREQGESTELTLTHELLETEELRNRHTEGWEACLANLLTFVC